MSPLKLVECKEKHTSLCNDDIIGDILYGEKYIVGRYDSRYKPSLIHNHDLFYLSMSECYNTWDLFNEDLSSQFEYECPFKEGNSYYWFVPHVIFTDDIKKYEEYIPSYYRNMAYDMEFMKRLQNPSAKSGHVQRAMLGHGYTKYTLPSDGDCELHLLDAQLDNGDMIVGWGWVWYNK